jgi:hypothetical protein
MSHAIAAGASRVRAGTRPITTTMASMVMMVNLTGAATTAAASSSPPKQMCRRFYRTVHGHHHYEAIHESILLTIRFRAFESTGLSSVEEHFRKRETTLSSGTG